MQETQKIASVYEFCDNYWWIVNTGQKANVRELCFESQRRTVYHVLNKGRKSSGEYHHGHKTCCFVYSILALYDMRNSRLKYLEYSCDKMLTCRLFHCERIWFVANQLLAHLSTKSSEWAIRAALRPSFVRLFVRSSLPFIFNNSTVYPVSSGKTFQESFLHKALQIC